MQKNKKLVIRASLNFINLLLNIQSYKLYVYKITTFYLEKKFVKNL